MLLIELCEATARLCRCDIDKRELNVDREINGSGEGSQHVPRAGCLQMQLVLSMYSGCGWPFTLFECDVTAMLSDMDVVYDAAAFSVLVCACVLDFMESRSIRRKHVRVVFSACFSTATDSSCLFANVTPMLLRWISWLCPS